MEDFKLYFALLVFVGMAYAGFVWISSLIRKDIEREANEIKKLQAEERARNPQAKIIFLTSPSSRWETTEFEPMVYHSPILSDFVTLTSKERAYQALAAGFQKGFLVAKCGTHIPTCSILEAWVDLGGVKNENQI